MLAAGLIALALSGPIAYSNTAGDLIRAIANASNETTLFAADGATALQALVISPDGKDVLALAAGAEPGLVLVPTTGGPPKPIGSTANADAGSISPDGKIVVFSTADGIYSVAVGGGTPTRLEATPKGAVDSLPQYAPTPVFTVPWSVLLVGLAAAVLISASLGAIAAMIAGRSDAARALRVA